MYSLEELMHECPVKAETTNILDLGKEMVLAIGRLRHAMKQCDKCELLDHCNFREQFNQVVDQVVDEITEAWMAKDEG